MLYNGQMDPYMRAGGKIIRPLDTVDLFILTVMYMWEIGLLIKLKERGHMTILTVPNISAIG